MIKVPEPDVGAVVPIERVDVRADTEDGAAELLGSMYQGHPVRFHAHDGAAALLVVRSAAAGRLRTDRLRSSLAFTTGVDPRTDLLCYHLLRGKILVHGGDGPHRFVGGEVVACPPGVARQVRVGPFDAVLLMLPWEPVAALAEQRTGQPAHGLRFQARTPISKPMGRYFAQVTRLVHHDLMSPSPAAANPLVAQQLAHTVATAALATFPNTTMTIGYLPGPGRVAPPALRRAIAYLDEHADQPIRQAEVAAAAGVSPRTLQYAFTRHYQTTPTGYLRRIRLRRAHHDLQTGDPACGDTVAGIAARWGFAKPSRFAAAYRDAYGVPPSQTLRG